MDRYRHILVIGIMTLGSSLIMILADRKSKKLNKNHFVLKYHTSVSIVLLLICAFCLAMPLLVLVYQGFSMNELLIYLFIYFLVDALLFFFALYFLLGVLKFM